MFGPQEHRAEFVLLFDVTDGNPNGDPDAGNLPRVDPETGEGLVTDVALKRKIRDYVALKHEYTPPHDIFVRSGAVLNRAITRSFAETEDEVEDDAGPSEKRQKARAWLCRNYYDIRTFGAVLSSGDNAGQVRGPVQMVFGRSVHPIIAQEHTITRMAVATEGEAEDQEGANRTMGRKHTIPYGLYRTHGFLSPPFAGTRGSRRRTWSCCSRP